MDVHPPHHAIASWKEFLVHMATIVLGLLIAIGLEQAVEWVHRNHQREQLKEAIHKEAENNLAVIDRDLHMQELEAWFADAASAVDGAEGKAGKMQLKMPVPPCVAGSVGTAAIRYFAPSEAVWTTAQASGLVNLLPVEEARMYARLTHNYALLADMRNRVHDGCQRILAMRKRFAHVDGDGEVWTMTPEQAEKLAESASQTRVDIQGLLFRLRWSKVYELGLRDGENHVDVKMMMVNQTEFEDQEK